MAKVEVNKTYIGVVEDNNDPKKLGRVRVRVLDIFDSISVDDIPWASPWKDLNGNGFNVPEKGKVVTIIFDQGNIYKPEFIFSDHYNINLERKALSLSGDNYTSMKSVIFDHKTQIYVNDDEGLKIDHKYNNMNILEGSINLNLKDNQSMLMLGDATAGQQAILGNHWMDWFDEFVDNLLNGPYLGNLMSPVVANSSFIDCLVKYKALRDPVFLSHHVNIVDNDKVSTVRMTHREDDSQYGDTWKSTVKKNELVKKKPSDSFKPKAGPKPEYDDTYVPPSTNGEPDTTPRPNTNPPVAPLNSTTSNTKIDKLVRFMKSKSYVVYDKPGLLNIVGMRNKGAKVSNKFDDSINVFYRSSDGNWELVEYTITTVPGYKPKTTELPDKVAILTPGQYIDQYKIDFHQGKTDHRCLKRAVSVVNRNDTPGSYNYNAITAKGSFGINIHRSSKTGSSENVFNWSEGCQVFKNISQFNQFMQLVDQQVSVGNKDTFTYTLCRLSEFDSFS